MITEIQAEHYSNVEVKRDNYFIDFMREAPEVCFYLVFTFN